MKVIPALTFNTKLDGWEKSKGFVKREIEMPTLNEKKDSSDALSVLIEVKYAGVCGTDRGFGIGKCSASLYTALSSARKRLSVFSAMSLWVK